MHKRAESEAFRKYCARRLGRQQLQVHSNAPHGVVPSGDILMLFPPTKVNAADSKHMLVMIAALCCRTSLPSLEELPEELLEERLKVPRGGVQASKKSGGESGCNGS